MFLDKATTIIHTDNIDSIKKRYGKIDTRELSYDELSDLLSDAEHIALSARKAMCDIEKKDNEIIINNGDEFEIITELTIVNEAEKKGLNTDSYDITCSFEDGIFKLHCPLTFKRNMKKDNLIDNYLLANYVELAIKKWQEDNNFNLKNSIKSPFVCVMERVANKFIIKNICDNDNLENSRIINTITRAFSLTDNAKNMDLYLKFSENSEEKNEGMNIFLFEKNQSNMAKTIF